MDFESREEKKTDFQVYSYLHSEMIVGVTTKTIEALHRRGLCSNGNYASVSKLVLHQNKKKFFLNGWASGFALKPRGKGTW